MIAGATPQIFGVAPGFLSPRSHRYQSLVALDPAPYRPAWRLRSAALIGILVAHAILSKLLYAHAESLASDDASADQWRQAAQILWYGGDVADLFLLLAFFGQWYALTRRRRAVRAFASPSSSGALALAPAPRSAAG